MYVIIYRASKRHNLVAMAYVFDNKAKAEEAATGYRVTTKGGDAWVIFFDDPRKD